MLRALWCVLAQIACLSGADYLPARFRQIKPALFFYIPEPIVDCLTIGSRRSASQVSWLFPLRTRHVMALLAADRVPRAAASLYLHGRHGFNGGYIGKGVTSANTDST